MSKFDVEVAERDYPDIILHIPAGTYQSIKTKVRLPLADAESLIEALQSAVSIAKSIV